MNPKHTLAALLLASTILFSCSKENNPNDPPDDPTYTRMDVTKVVLTNISATDLSGENWDNPIFDNAAPDIYFSFINAAGDAMITSTISYNTTTAMLPVTWTFTTPFNVPDFNGQYSIRFWDDDTNLSNPNDLMTTITNLSPSNLVVAGYPSTTQVISSDGKFKATLWLNWYN